VAGVLGGSSACASIACQRFVSHICPEGEHQPPVLPLPELKNLCSFRLVSDRCLAIIYYLAVPRPVLPKLLPAALWAPPKAAVLHSHPPPPCPPPPPCNISAAPGHWHLSSHPPCPTCCYPLQQQSLPSKLLPTCSLLLPPLTSSSHCLSSPLPPLMRLPQAQAPPPPTPHKLSLLRTFILLSEPSMAMAFPAPSAACLCCLPPPSGVCCCPSSPSPPPPTFMLLSESSMTIVFLLMERSTADLSEPRVDFSWTDAGGWGCGGKVGRRKDVWVGCRWGAGGGGGA
jgi:hypothetical protein